jgi:uncharacterized membrane protein YphA (DoxX/SURF4 family)
MALPDGMVSPASSSRRRGTPSSWKRRHLHHVISSLFPTGDAVGPNMINFWKNVSIAGAFLLLAITGPGAISLDRR